MTVRRARGVSPGIKALLATGVVVVVAALAGAVEPARACSCVPPDPWALLRQADGAFVGRLTERDDIGDGRARLTFSVERAVKGNIGSSVEVVTPNNGDLSSFGPSTAYLRAGFTADRFVRVDLDSGRVLQLARLPLSPSLAPEDSGKLFAGAAYRLDRRSRLVVVDLRRRPAIVRSIPLSARVVFGEVLWISRTRLLFLSADRRERARLLDLRLRTLARFRWTGGQGILVRSSVFGIGQRSLLFATLPSGPTRVARQLPGQPAVIVAAAR